jgi:hypothetical protein
MTEERKSPIPRGQRSSRLIEAMAAEAHESWAQWMEYLYSKSTKNPDGSVTIPAASVERWNRQMDTAYDDLPENEKESDREEARRYLHVILGTSL